MPVGITREGRWVPTTGDRSALAIDGRRLPEVTDGSGVAVVLAPDPTSRGIEVVDARDGVRALSNVDVVFPVLHGAFGEDGTMQGLLEMAGLPYVGSGVFASAAAMDKEFTRKLAVAEGIPAITGREIECGVLDGESGAGPQASVLAEIRIAGGHEFYDFDAKYLDEGCAFDVPADLPPDVTDRHGPAILDL